MLEPMSRSSTDQNRIRPIGMPVDEEVPIGAVFILADACFNELRTLKRGKSAVHVCSDPGQASRRSGSIAAVGINGGAMPIIGNLEAARFQIGKPVVEIAAIEVCPTGQRAGIEPPVTPRWGKEEDLLSRWEDS